MTKRVTARWALLIAALTIVIAGAIGQAVVTPSQATPSGPGLHVSGNHLVNAEGDAVRLLGVNRSGTEYACVQGWGIFDGPSDQASVTALAAWHVNAVRIPLNEDCWLGINGVASAVSGPAYRDAVAAYVGRLNGAGMIAVLDLHWGAPGTQKATSQEKMPDADRSVAFWKSVAEAFAHTPGVVLDLFNEPHDVSWPCWRNGCYMAGGTKVVGMQTLVDVVRSTGATQPIVVEGLGWATDMRGWLAHEPDDPDHALIAGVHLYNFKDCSRAKCWEAQIAPLASRVPVLTGEMGESDCSSRWVDRYTEWADHHSISYMAWAWDAGGGWSCTSGPGLIKSYAGTPTAYGAGFRAHLSRVEPAEPPLNPAEAPRR